MVQLNGLQVAVLNWSDFAARDEGAAAIEYALLSAEGGKRTFIKSALGCTFVVSARSE